MKNHDVWKTEGRISHIALDIAVRIDVDVVLLSADEVGNNMNCVALEIGVASSRNASTYPLGMGLNTPEARTISNEHTIVAF